VKKLLFLIFLLICSVSQSDVYGPSGAKAMLYGFSSDTFGLSLESSYANSKANFDPNGNAINLGGSQLTELRFNILGSYDFNNLLGGYAELTFNRDDVTTSTAERVNSGFSQGVLGLEGVAFSGFIKIIPEIALIAPFVGQPDSSATSALIGNGVYVATAKVNLNKRFKHFVLFGYGGYNYSTGGISGNIPYGFVARGDFKSFFADLGISGISSLNGDQYSNNLATRQQITNFVEGGSLAYDAINPAWTNLDSAVGFRFLRNYSFSLGLEQSLAGQNTAQETRFLLTFIYNSTPTRVMLSPDEGHPSPENDSEKFEVDTSPEDSRYKRH
jgi:hypothetical protein